MNASDAAFAGSIPALYDRHLAPLLFEPFARVVAERAAALRPQRILETAAGTSVVTAALHDALPEAEIVATDLNQGMLDVAARRFASDKVRLAAADAQALPFEPARFDLVVCQFGVMFFPDKVEANREARRVLRDGGHYLAVIWDRLERNPVSKAASQAVAELFPGNPPRFLERTPFGYGDPTWIEHDLVAAGFTDIEFETVVRTSRVKARDAAAGLALGSPLRAEIEARDPAMLDAAVEAAAAALAPWEGQDGPMSAHLVTAVK
ncbi:methyltransferase domain-containing protein [Sphingomonas sp.]|uniref:class I SAM-dependent methyltransferase n=1 Tax=Sphingomonas sp. TaxID=28214 RepID=UPI00286D7F93|nr:methyltransferase domain-containing protein [Sphingomonas sp.]